MPCGGIHPIPIEFLFNGEPASIGEEATCFYCNKKVDKYDLFCDEWDCYLHYECVSMFLATEEGQIVLKHGHEILMYSREAIEEYYKENKDEV